MSERAPVEFEVIAADAGTEIFLIDGHFELLKKGIGREKFSVPPGIYKIKARSGKTATEKMIIVRPGMDPVRLDPLPLSSAMPLRRAAKTHEFHEQAAQQAAASPTVTLGTGSAIVIVVRQWTAPEPPSPPPTTAPNPARGLTLRDMGGAVLVDVEARTTVTHPFDPCVAVHVGVNPGAYRLTLAQESGRRVEQTLIACAGWQTHVYLLADDRDDPRQRRADLVNGAVTMRQPGAGFDPVDPMLRLEEIARGALVDDRKILSDEVRSLIARRDCPPMLALIGAHLLIREAKDAKAKQEDAPGETAAVVDSRAPVRAIVENLRASIGAHPDVEALAVGAGNQDRSYVFDAPPLFRASWRLLVKASAGQSELIPAASFGARIADRLWGEGSWLLWLDPDMPDAVDRSTLWQTKVRTLLASIEGTPPERLSTPEDAMKMPSGMTSMLSTGVAALRLWVKSKLATRSHTPFPDLRAGAARAIADRATANLAALRARLSDEQWRSLVKAVGVPRSSISAWLDRLDR